MDPYGEKLNQMKGYIPFLNKMISKLERAGDPSKDTQLSKMKSLLAILNTRNKNIELHTLVQCEDVLHKLYEKVEGQPLYRSSIPPHETGFQKKVRPPPRSPSPQRPREDIGFGRGRNLPNPSSPPREGWIHGSKDNLAPRGRNTNPHNRGRTITKPDPPRGYGHSDPPWKQNSHPHMMGYDVEHRERNERSGPWNSSFPQRGHSRRPDNGHFQNDGSSINERNRQSDRHPSRNNPKPLMSLPPAPYVHDSHTDNFNLGKQGRGNSWQPRDQDSFNSREGSSSSSREFSREHSPRGSFTKNTPRGPNNFQRPLDDHKPRERYSRESSPFSHERFSSQNDINQDGYSRGPSFVPQQENYGRDRYSSEYEAKNHSSVNKRGPDVLKMNESRDYSSGPPETGHQDQLRFRRSFNPKSDDHYNERERFEEEFNGPRFSDDHHGPPRDFYHKPNFVKDRDHDRMEKKTFHPGSSVSPDRFRHSSMDSNPRSRQPMNDFPPDNYDSHNEHPRQSDHYRRSREEGPSYRQRDSYEREYFESNHQRSDSQESFFDRERPRIDHRDEFPKKNRPQFEPREDFGHREDFGPRERFHSGHRDDYNDRNHSHSRYREHGPSPELFPPSQRDYPRVRDPPRKEPHPEVLEHEDEGFQSARFRKDSFRGQRSNESFQDSGSRFNHHSRDMVRKEEPTRFPGQSFTKQNFDKQPFRKSSDVGNDLEDFDSSEMDYSDDSYPRVSSRSVEKKPPEHHAPQSFNRERFPPKNYDSKPNFDPSFRPVSPKRSSPINPPARFVDDVPKRPGGRRVLLPLPDHPPEFFNDRDFETRREESMSGPRPSSHSGSVERPQRAETLSRPPPPDSPPSLDTPMSPKSDDENTHHRAPIEENVPVVIPLERNFPPVRPLELISPASPTQEAPNEITPLSPSPMDKGPGPQTAQARPQLIPTSPEKPVLLKPNQNPLIPGSGHSENANSSQPQPEISRPPLGRVQSTRTALLPSPRFQTPFNRPPCNELEKSCFVRPPLPAPEDFSIAGEAKDHSGGSPQDWQRQGNTALPLRNQLNPRYPPSFPRHPFVRPPGPPGKNFTPRQQGPGPSPRPLTYGEYRKLRESFESRSNPSIVRSPLHLGSPSSGVSDGSPQSTPEEPKDQPTTTQPVIVMNSRDPRRNPANRVTGPMATTISSENSPMSPIHTSTSAFGLGSFKIPKKRQPDSEPKSETSISSEFGSDSEPELRIAEHESDHHDSTDDEAAKLVIKSPDDNDPEEIFEDVKPDIDTLKRDSRISKDSSHSEEEANFFEVKDEVKAEPITPTKAFRGRGRGRGRSRGKHSARRSSRFNHGDQESDIITAPDSDEETANLVIDENRFDSDEKPPKEEFEDTVFPSQSSNRSRGKGRRGRGRPKGSQSLKRSPSKSIELKIDSPIKDEPKDDPPPMVELSEEDLNIFMISEDFIPEEPSFTFQKPPQITEAKTLPKPTLSGLSSLFEKLQHLDEESEESCQSEPKDITDKSVCLLTGGSKLETEEIPVNLIPPTRYDNLDEILQEIDTEVPNEPLPQVSTLSSLLLSNEEVDEETCQSFVERDSNIQLSHSEKESLRSQYASVLKDSSSLSVMLRHINLKQLFKCMVKEKCAFTSDDAIRFKNHLNERHAPLKNKLRHGWLKCCYCLRKLSSPAHLVSHVIKRHGSSKYQCSYCFFRDTTATGLMIHQKVYHKNEDFNYLQCRSIPFNSSLDLDYEPPTTRIFSCQIKKCNYLTVSDIDLAKHLFIEHKKSDGNFADFTCTDCENSFDSVGRLALHCSLMHQRPPIGVVKHVERLDLNDTDFSSTESIPGSTVDSDDEDGEDKAGCEDAEKVTITQPFPSLKEDTDQVSEIDLGFSGRKLYRCGNTSCLYSAETASAFRDHAVTCIFSKNALSVDCFHCQKPFKHVPTLLDHLKNHGLKRYSCSICSTYKAATAVMIKSHLKVAHRVPNSKILPVIPNKTNPDEDYFICIPKNCLVKSRLKDTFSPDEISELPHNAILSYLIRCSLCDFATKVRMNLIKHLRLHTKNSDKIPVITPVNQPESEEGNLGFAKMTSLLEADQEEEKARIPLSEEEHRKLPALIDEESRYSCRECDFTSIDELLLGYHLETFHPELRGMFACPHCTSEVENSQAMNAEEAQFHYKCHGELLFKCGHCSYYHWQKRTAEEHVAKNHIGHKQYTRDVRLEYRNLMISKLNPPKPESEKKKNQPKEKKPPPPYEPYKCGLCDYSDKSLDGIQEHSRNVHNLQHRFKCCLCELTSDCKVDLEKHLSTSHGETGTNLPLIRVYHIDPSSLTTSATEVTYDEIRLPIWHREMPGLRHIRGILFNDESEDYMEDQPEEGSTTVSSGSGKLDEDSLTIDCVKCGSRKNSVRGLKMHILLAHLKSGKFRCTRCEFTSNIKNSILAHSKSMHPPTDQIEEYVERNQCDPKSYSQEFWKHNWNIPTLEERRLLSHRGTSGAEEFKMDPKRKPGDLDGVRKEKKKTKLLQKKHFAAKKLMRQTSAESENEVDPNLKFIFGQGLPEHGRKIKDTSIQEISPFENVVTYRCIFCAKRFQQLEKVERHLEDFHPGRTGLSETSSDREAELGYRALTRDQVVNLITTSSVGEHSAQAEFKCFYCEDVVGDIYQVQEHFIAEHDPSIFKVKRVQDGKRGIPGYLECQICGYLSPGFGRSGQKVHFHEEHPSETVVNASKYVSKTRQTTVDHGLPIAKFDPLKYQGMTITCPRADCQLQTQTMPAMLSHFRKHTVTFKCGHCGKVNRSSAEFYQHSGMSHGNKIPDHVKDPEAEAEFEALRGLVEANLEKEYSGQQRQDLAKRSYESLDEDCIPVKIPKMASDFDGSLSTNQTFEQALPSFSTDSSLDAWCNN